MIGIVEEHGVRSNLVEETRHAFSTEGLLSKSPQFEFRAQQQDLATAIADTLLREQSLVAEAGTGVGKSLAYLIPAIQYALDSDKKCLLSTHTINLQEQLLNKDVPLAARLLGKPITYTLLKGRQNYLCPTRLTRALQGKGDLFTSSEALELKKIYDWAQETEDGTLSDIDFKPSYRVWSAVCSESELCTQRRCGPSGKCHYQEARKRANESQVIILNHTLFFSLLDLDDIGDRDGYLFPRDFIIFDEAHTLENVAAKQLGLRVSAAGLKMELGKIYNSRSKKGIIRSAERLDLAPAVEKVYEMADHFFDGITESLFPDGVLQAPTPANSPNRPRSKEVRVRESDVVPNTLGGPIGLLRGELSEILEDTENEMLQSEVTDCLRRLGDVQDGISQFLNMEDEESVYWAEQSGGEYTSVTLHSAPTNVAERLRDVLFGGGKTAIMTSATLSVSDGDVQYFKRRIGAERAGELVLGSPFDLATQMETYVAAGITEPKDPRHIDELKHWVTSFLQYCGGKAFVLFTSYRAMKDVALEVEQLCRANGWDCYVQGQGSSRQQMLQGFRDSGNGVLLGTDSFWTGVDVPGEALSNVIIARLPFEVPSHPVVQARLENIEFDGGNAFMDYSLPEAVLKFRQGIGRLIRSKSDRGKVLILDSRVVSKRYGKTFLECMAPSPIRRVQSPAEFVRA